MYVVSLVFFGFAVRKYKDQYIPASVAMMLWFLVSAVVARPAALVVPYLEILSVAEKVVFAVMAILLLRLCVLRKKPLRLDWFPLAGTALAVAVRLGWYGYYHWFMEHIGPDNLEQLALVQSWKSFILQGILCAVAVWHIYWISRPRFIK